MKKIPLILLLAGLVLAVGCQTTSDPPSPKNDQASVAGTKKSGADQTNTSGKVKFREPDDSWTFLKITAIDDTSPDSIAHGYVAMTKGEFRFLMEGDYVNARIYVSGNYGRINISGVQSSQWEGVLDDKTPIGLQPFFMIAQAFQIAQSSALDSTGMRFSFRGLKGPAIESAEIYFGNVTQGNFFPSDFVVQYLKTKMQMSLLIEE